MLYNTKVEMLKQVQHDNKRRGFTLIELLVVVLIIGILAAVAVPQYKKAVEKSKLVQAIADVRAIYQELELYRLQEGEYPPHPSNETSVNINYFNQMFNIELTQKPGFIINYAPNKYITYRRSETVWGVSMLLDDERKGELICFSASSDANHATEKAICLSLCTNKEWYKGKSGDSEKNDYCII